MRRQQLGGSWQLRWAGSATVVSAFKSHGGGGGGGGVLLVPVAQYPPQYAATSFQFIKIIPVTLILHYSIK